MKKTLFFAFCLLCVASLLRAQDSGPVYIIDGKTIENFDGSQLQKKYIRDYTVNKIVRDGVEITIHSITTNRYPGTMFEISGAEKRLRLSSDTLNFGVSKPTIITGDDKNVCFIVDGKKKDMKYISSIPPEQIDNITVLKDAESVKKYGNYDGVIIIQTKN